MRRPPSDFDLLRATYGRHRADYGSALQTPSGRTSDVLVPIDIPAIAEQLHVDTASVFGRLYYHLDRQYGEPREEGKARKAFFTPRAGQDVNCVNFPLLEAVLAGMWQQRRRDLWVTFTAVTSFGISLASLIVAIAL